MWLNVPEADAASPDGQAPPAKLLVLAGTAKRRQRAALALIPLSQITPNPDQPRKHFDQEGLAELAESIKERGVIQPVLVRWTGEGGYELLAGERRLRASQLAGLAVIPSLVRHDDDPLEVALIENRDLGGILGKSRPYVSNVLSLLRLPARVKEEIHREGHQVSRELLMGIARAPSEEDAETLWDRVKINLMSVRRFREERSGTAARPRTRGREIILAARRLNRTLKRMAESGESVDSAERDSVLRALRKSLRLIQRHIETL
jgi:ParB-like chromosome segregation protein Spo0J